MTKVTLGLCVKNSARTVSHTLNSIRSQRFPSDQMELIVVDGLSTDGTLQIMENYLDSSAEFNYEILSDGGLGLAYARQLVLQKSKGDFIVWVDGDHILPSNYVKNQLEFMEKHPRVGAAEAITLPAPNSNWVARLEGYTWTIYGLRNLDKFVQSVDSAGTIYLKRAMTEAGGYDTRFKKAGEDGDISRRIVKKGWKLAINPNAYYYHICRDSFRGLFHEYYNWGMGAYMVGKKHVGAVSPARFFLAPLAGFLLAIKVAKKFHDSASLLLPLHYTLKRAAWLWGYYSGHIKGLS
ncbi:MAG: glycosyltransferase [Candidatus Caldarchaeum sp.]